MIRGSSEKHKVHEPGAHVIHKYYKIINTHYTSGIIVMVYRSLLQESKSGDILFMGIHSVREAAIA